MTPTNDQSHAFSAACYASTTNTMQINYGDGGKLFVPFDLMVGKKLFDSFVASVEFSHSLYHNKGFEPYKWLLEARIGYYF
jgi:hypothetical protein